MAEIETENAYLLADLVWQIIKGLPISILFVILVMLIIGVFIAVAVIIAYFIRNKDTDDEIDYGDEEDDD